MQKHRKSLVQKKSQTDIVSPKQTISTWLVPLLAITFLTTLIALIYYNFGDGAASILTASSVVAYRNPEGRQRTTHPSIPPSDVAAASLALQKQLNAESRQLISASEGASSSASSSSTPSDTPTHLVPLNWEYKVVYVYADDNHADVEKGQEIIQRIVDRCQERSDDCLVVLEGQCDPLGGNRYSTSVLTSVYDYGVESSRGAIYRFEGPKACVGTGGFFAKHSPIHAYTKRLEADIQQLIEYAKKMEKICRKTMEKDHCGFPPGWFNRIEKQWADASLTQKTHFGVLIREGLNQIIAAIEGAGNRYVATLKDREQLKTLNSNIIDTTSRINDQIILMHKEQVKSGDLAAIAAMESIHRNFPHTKTTCLRIGSAHLHEDGALSQYLLSLIHQGASVRMVTSMGTEKAFRPSPVVSTYDSFLEQTRRDSPQWRHQNYGLAPGEELGKDYLKPKR